MARYVCKKCFKKIDMSLFCRHLSLVRLHIFEDFLELYNRLLKYLNIVWKIARTCTVTRYFIVVDLSMAGSSSQGQEPAQDLKPSTLKKVIRIFTFGLSGEPAFLNSSIFEEISTFPCFWTDDFLKWGWTGLSRGDFLLVQYKGRRQMIKAKGRGEKIRAKGRGEKIRAKGRGEKIRAKGEGRRVDCGFINRTISGY